MFDVLLINPGTEKETKPEEFPINDDLDQQFVSFKQQLLSTTPTTQYNREPPTGLLLLAAIIEQSEYSVELFDCSITETYLEELKEKAPNYRVFGLTTLTNTLQRTINIASALKLANPQAIIILGGPHASFCYEELLIGHPEFDLIAVGESENVIVPLLELLLQNPIQYFSDTSLSNLYRKEFPLSEIPFGFAIRTLDQQVSYFPSLQNTLLNSTFEIFFRGWPNPVDINKNPLPARHFLEIPYNVADISFNRGCPNQCSFCSRQKLFKNDVRIRSIDQLQAELEEIKNNFRYSSVNFYDNININRSIFHEFLDLLIHMGFSIPWGCELRADILTQEECKKMKQAGCKVAATGIESADPSVLKRNFKYQDPEKVANGIRFLKAAGIKIQAYFVIGLPGETINTFQTTLNYLQQLGLGSEDEIDFFLATPYPGSRLADDQVDFQISILDNNYTHFDCEHLIFTTDTLSKGEIYQMYQDALALVKQIKLTNL